jgi:uncharacterized membrane protein YtjA (UPF0391 family)
MTFCRGLMRRLVFYVRLRTERQRRYAYDSEGIALHPSSPFRDSSMEHAPCDALKTENRMLYWAIVFFVIAVIAGILGFGGVAAGAAGTAKILFVVFVVLLVLSLISGGMRRGGPRL